MTIYGVSFDLVSKQPIVLLKTAEGNRFLPIWIGHPEAAAILVKLQGASAPRPLTHDLLVNMLTELDVEVLHVTVTELRENTFHASITVRQNGSEIEVDSRSSDAIAVAVRAQVPIYAADAVVEESAIEWEGDEVDEEKIVDEFRSFLFRGLGFSLLAQRRGSATAIVATGLAFGVYHGLVQALPSLVLIGCALAWLRARTRSVYPGMLVHATFNAVALIGAVTVG